MNTAGTNSVIHLDNVRKKYGRKLVLDNINLQVPAGCVFALLGENGAGKSTLIRGLMGYHRFDSGSISVAGLDPFKQPMELRRKVAYVSDAPSLYEWMTVAEAGWYASGLLCGRLFATLCGNVRTVFVDAGCQDSRVIQGHAS